MSNYKVKNNLAPCKHPGCTFNTSNPSGYCLDHCAVGLLGETALRYNSGKRRFSLVPASFIRALTDVFEAGAKKYAAWNWTKSLNTADHDVFVADRLDSLMRHLDALRENETSDSDTGQPHAVLIAWNALVIWWYGENKKENKT